MIKIFKESLSSNIFLLFKTIFVGFLIAIIYHGLLNIAGYHFPWNTFLFNPADRFNDWFNSVNQAQSTNPYFFTGPALATYFPSAYVLFQISFCSDKLVKIGIYFFISILLLFFALNTLNLKCQSFPAKLSRKDIFFLFFSTLLAYPVLFALDRGNIDFWIALLSVIFIFTHNTRYHLLGALTLSIAISLKGYPAAFLLLLFAERKWVEIVVIALTVSLLTFLPLCFMWDGYEANVSGLLKNLDMYYQIYVLGGGSLFASSDPYNAIRLILLGANKIFAPNAVNIEDISLITLYFYTPFSFFFSLIITIYVLFTKAAYWRKVLALSLLIILFPNVANDYKLCILLPSFYLMIFENLNNNPSKRIFILILILLIPKSYLFLYGRPISMIVNPAVLLLIAYYVLNDPIEWNLLISKLKQNFISLEKSRK